MPAVKDPDVVVQSEDRLDCRPAIATDAIVRGFSKRFPHIYICSDNIYYVN
jgi:hypothetical protein